MADHLWQRPSGWTYQRRLPKPLVKYSRRIVIRVTLGRLSYEAARSKARLISVAIDRIRDEVATMEREGTQSLAEKADAAFESLMEQLDSQTAQIEEAMALIRRDQEDRERERAAFRTALLTAGAAPLEPLPLFSAFAAKVADNKAEALNSEKGYASKLRNTARAWVLVHGDRALDAYLPSMVQEFATALASLPKAWAVTPRFRPLSYAEIVADFDRAKIRAQNAGKKKPLALSRTTIGEYAAQLRHIMQHARADHPTRVADFAAAPMTLPRAAPRAKIRGPLDAQALSTWLARTAVARRPDDRFLPLLGALTGARLGELTDLQPGDLRRDGAHWVLDLREDLDDGEGDEVERQVKTNTSRRVVVLHDLIAETGFVEWVHGLRGQWVFPRLHGSGKKTILRPAATASKRMIRSMKAAGVHVPTTGVFHSLRHGLKDWLRSRLVPDRTIDLQVGHAHETVSASYGSWYLRSDEIRLLATLPLPEGIDFTPYQAQRSGTSVGP